MTDRLGALTAVRAVELMRAEELSVEHYARSLLERIGERESVVKAWAWLDPDFVIRRARVMDRRRVRGPLHGLPIGVKDIFLTRDMPTRYNSPLSSARRPCIDAAVVALLRRSGALIFGKTTTVEFGATGAPPPTCNPLDPRRTPGGSSSGSAAAVADRHVPIALGTQTGGSMIRPASFCGVFAFKPSWGLVSNEGVKRFAPSLDTVGWFARTAGDLVLILDALDPDAGPPVPVAATDLRIALCRTPFWAAADGATQETLERAAGFLRSAGAEIVPLDLPASFDDLSRLHGLIMNGEGRSSFLAEYRTDPSRLHPHLRDMVKNTRKANPADLSAAYTAAAIARDVFDRLAWPFHAVLAPSAVGHAPIGISETGNMVFNALWTLLHVPCVNVPGLSASDQLPVGVTLTGARYSDRRVLAVAGLTRICDIG